MKIVVTGGGGFIGSHAALRFASDGWNVVVLDNLSRARLLGSREGMLPPNHNWDRIKQNSTIQRVRGDVRNEMILREVVHDSDVVIHAAAQVAVTSSIENPRVDLETNVLGTFNVLEAARAASTDPVVVVTSTNKVYGANVNGVSIKEERSRLSFADKRFKFGIPSNFPIDSNDHTPYGTSKLAADQYVRDYSKTYGLKSAVLRMSCIYGEHQLGVEDQGWVAHFVISSLRGKSITIFGSGKQVRDVLHVDDLVELMVLLVRAPQSLDGRAFNVGGGSKYTLSLLELLDWLEAYSGVKPRVRFEDWRPSDQKVYISDIREAKESFGWSPEIAPRDGIRRLFGWYRPIIAHAGTSNG